MVKIKCYFCDKQATHKNMIAEQYIHICDSEKCDYEVWLIDYKLMRE